MGGGTTDYAYSLALDASGNIYTTGTFSTTADFDPGAGIVNKTSSGPNSLYISKLDPSGNYVRAIALGGSELIYGMSIAIDGSYNLYTTGKFSGNIYLGGLSEYYSTSSLYDIFVLKTGQCVTPIDVSTTVNGNTLTANLDGASYEWLHYYDNKYWHTGNALTQSYSPPGNGQYAVLVTAGSCTDTSEIINYVFTDINESDGIDNSILLYPNPTKGELMFELTSEAETTITDALGKIVYTNNLNEGKHSLDITGEQNGIYFVKIKSAEVQSIKKIVLNRISYNSKQTQLNKN